MPSMCCICWRTTLEAIEQQGEAQVRLAGRPFRIRKNFVDDVRAQKVRDAVRNLRRALLVMHSPVDELVPSTRRAHLRKRAAPQELYQPGPGRPPADA